MDIRKFKERFDAILAAYVERKITQATNLLGDKKLNSFVEYIHPFIFAGGKRIRPYCVWAAYTGFGGKQEKEILDFAMVFELFHTMALIHDDIIDQADKRHNGATMHTFIAKKIGQENFHIAEGQAMLIGDLLLSWVYELRNAHPHFSEQLLQEAKQNVHSMIEEVILGQMIDVDMMTGGQVDAALLEKKNTYKTGSYTFIRPLLTGAILAGASHDQRTYIKELGKSLGEAFQVRDDLMDILGTEETKTPFSDIQEGQQTYFTQYIFTQGTEQEKVVIKEALGKKLTPEKILLLQEIFHKSGALEAGKNHIQNNIQKAKAILDQIQFSNSEGKESLTLLIEKIASV